VVRRERKADWRADKMRAKVRLK